MNDPVAQAPVETTTPETLPTPLPGPVLASYGKQAEGKPRPVSLIESGPVIREGTSGGEYVLFSDGSWRNTNKKRRFPGLSGRQLRRLRKRIRREHLATTGKPLAAVPAAEDTASTE